MMDERVGAQYQNWYDRSSLHAAAVRAQRALAREAHSGRSQASAAHVMPSATSWSALGVIMSGLCQPTLCQPRSSTTTWCSSSSASEQSGFARRAKRRAGAARSRAEAGGSLSHHDDVRLGVEIRNGGCGRGGDKGEVGKEIHSVRLRALTRAQKLRCASVHFRASSGLLLSRSSMPNARGWARPEVSSSPSAAPPHCARRKR